MESVGRMNPESGSEIRQTISIFWLLLKIALILLLAGSGGVVPAYQGF